MSDERKLRGIYVEWWDHHGGIGWHDADEVDDSRYLIKSLGIFIKETDKTIVIARAYCVDNDQVNGTGTIMKCAIKRRRWVKIPA